MVGVKLGVCAKIISVGDGESDGDEETAGEGDKETVDDGDKATVGPTVGAFVGVRHAWPVHVGLKVGVLVTTIVGLTNASLRTELFCFIKIKTKITTIIVNKEIIKKTNLE